MSKHRETKRKEKLAELLPIMAMSRDHRASIFRRSRSRSMNSPEVALAHESLTEWLNEENSSPSIDLQYRNSSESTQRILDLLNLVRKVVTAFEQEAPEMYPYFYGKAAEPHYSFEGQEIVHFGAISRALVDYATVPFLAFQMSTKLWGLGHSPVGLPGTVHNGMMEVLQPTLRPYGEVMAAHGILELARSEALHRIKQCDCKRWFFMKRKDGVACSDTCRKRIHDRKPEVINRRKVNAKTNEDYKSGKIHIRKPLAKQKSGRQTRKPRAK
jgi:hypothetical protein